MTDEKKGWQIDFSSTNAESSCQIDAEYTRFLTIGATFSFLGTAFSSFEGFPPLLVIALLMLSMILTVYAYVMKVAVHTAPKEEHLSGSVYALQLIYSLQNNFNSLI